MCTTAIVHEGLKTDTQANIGRMTPFVEPRLDIPAGVEQGT